jgi:phenylacetate-CoA ligase
MPIEDFLHPWREVYRISPWWFKRSAGQLYAMLPMRVRYGRLLHEARELLAESQWWSDEQHREYQWSRMKQLLEHCYRHVPYYRRAMREAGLAPGDFKAPEDWCRLPLLTKDVIRSHKEDLVAENLRALRLAANTGGSTGQPLELYWERGRTRSLERAFMWRQWAWGGFRYGQKTMVTRGQRVKEGLWHYDPIDRQLFVNAYNLSQEAICTILGKLRRFRPVSIQAYPSTATTFALTMRERGDPPIEGVKVLLCGSENLYPEQKKLLQEAFQARVYSWYGHAEVCCLAGYCDQADDYHVYSEYGYVELVDPSGKVLEWRPGQRGEIVGTSLINDVMPLVRYRTGDIGVAGPQQCVCGRRYRLLARVEGRKQEYIITADGRAISLTGLVFGQHWHAFSKIRQLQLVQDKPGVVVVLVVKGAGFDEQDEVEIKTKMTRCVGEGFEARVEYVESIPTTATGKHIFLRQALAVPSTWAGEVEAAHG